MSSAVKSHDPERSGAELLAARLSVRIQPRSKREGVESVHDGVVKIRVSAPPVDDKANEAVRKLMAKSLKVHRSRVALVKGSRSRDKVFEISGMSSSDALERLKESV